MRKNIVLNMEICIQEVAELDEHEIFLMNIVAIKAFQRVLFTVPSEPVYVSYLSRSSIANFLDMIG